MSASPRTAICRSTYFQLHDTGEHVENPGRVAAIDAELERSGLLEGRVQLSFERAPLESIARAHDERVVHALADFAAKGGGWIDGDTYCGPESFDVARTAAGAAIAAVDAVLDGTTSHAFSLGRPPGHHATRTRPMGFCLLNNVAIAACHALQRGIQRVAIIDWDVHHGNGTQDIFYESDDVLFCSIHQYGRFYPGTGSHQERGEGSGHGHTINVPLAAGAGDAVYLEVMDEIVHLPIQEFHPELILVSAGFDAHADDPLGSMNVSDAGFARMAQRVCDFAAECRHERVVAVLEGGYDPGALGRSVRDVIRVFDGETPVPNDETSAAG